MVIPRRIRFSLSLFLLAAFGWAGAVQAQSPTPVTSIVNSNQDTTLQVGYNGSLLMPGTRLTDHTANDSIPAEGAGTRLMWYPEKAAFRAGRVGNNKDGTQWDASEVGPYSAAFGVDTRASGFNSMAVGSATTARGISATAMGEGSVAATPRSLSIGECNSANSGQSRDQTLFAVGNGAFDNGNCRSRSDALVLDRDGNLNVDGNLNIGSALTAAGKIETNSIGVELPDGTVLSGNEDLGVPTNSNGAFDLSNEDGVVASGTFGSGSIPASGAGPRLMWYPAKAAFRAGQAGSEWDDANVGEYSVALGEDTEASASRTTALGEETVAIQRGATAMGFESIASGLNAVAMGDRTTASGSGATTMGDRTSASGDNATAMGFGTEAETARSLSVGECNSSNTSADNTLFVVGSGSYDDSNDTCNSQDDAFTVDESGSATASSHDTFSDRRLKTRVEPIGEGVLEALRDIDPVRYQFKDQSTHPSGEQVGLIAQDVREEFPSLVNKGAGGYLSLAYPKLTAVLLKGIQEQQAELETKKQEIATLKAENEEIKERLAALERQHSSALPARLVGPLGLAVLLGLGGLIVSLLWHRRE